MIKIYQCGSYPPQAVWIGQSNFAYLFSPSGVDGSTDVIHNEKKCLKNQEEKSTSQF